MEFPRANPEHPSIGRRNARKTLAVYLAVAFAISSFLWGYRMGATRASSSGESAMREAGVAATHVEDIEFEQFWELWDVIKERYARQPVSEEDLFYGALGGMVASLDDPHSVFMPPQETEEFSKELSGKFEGIGAEIGIKNGNLVIVAPLEQSPAERAGLRPADRVLAIDDVDTTGMALDDAVSRIRGDKGTKVKLHVLRGKEETPRLFEIVRDVISIRSVKVEFLKSPKGKSIAVIRVTHFNGDTFDRFQEAVGQATARKVDGLILDLRNNPGGFLDSSIDMLGEWTPGEIAVSERFSDGHIEDHRSSGLGRLSGLKTVVLVNGGSASASEIVAGALHDRGKGTLIGEQTFGKGSVQDLVEFKDGSSVKLTIAEWLTPDGVNINVDGIAPDYVVVRTAEDYEKERDPQLDAAKAFFDGVMPPQDSATNTSR